MTHCQSSAGPYISSKKFRIWQRKHRPVQESDCFSVSIILCKLSSSKLYIQWKSERFFFHHGAMTWRLNTITVKELHLNRREVVADRDFLFCFCCLKSIRVFSTFFSEIFTCRLRSGILTSQISPARQCLNPKYLPSRFHRNNTNPKNIPDKTFLSNWWSLHKSLKECWKCSNNALTGMISPSTWVPESSPIRSSPISDCNGILKNQPTIFNSRTIAFVQQTLLLLLCAPSARQSHLFLICVA